MRAPRTHVDPPATVRTGLSIVFAALWCAACARTSEVPDEARASATVFTDSALFRQNCLEADSGHTISVQRCTPRNQANQPGERLERQPPESPPQP